MIGRNDFNRITLACDLCGFMAGGEYVEWIEAWPALQDEGWRSFIDDTAWAHRCPACVDAWNNVTATVKRARKKQARKARRHKRHEARA